MEEPPRHRLGPHSRENWYNKNSPQAIWKKVQNYKVVPLQYGDFSSKIGWRDSCLCQDTGLALQSYLIILGSKNSLDWLIPQNLQLGWRIEVPGYSIAHIKITAQASALPHCSAAQEALSHYHSNFKMFLLSFFNSYYTDRKHHRMRWKRRMGNTVKSDINPKNFPKWYIRGKIRKPVCRIA